MDIPENISITDIVFLLGDDRAMEIMSNPTITEEEYISLVGGYEMSSFEKRMAFGGMNLEITEMLSVIEERDNSFRSGHICEPLSPDEQEDELLDELSY